MVRPNFMAFKRTQEQYVFGNSREEREKCKVSAQSG